MNTKTNTIKKALVACLMICIIVICIIVAVTNGNRKEFNRAEYFIELCQQEFVVRETMTSNKDTFFTVIVEADDVKTTLDKIKSIYSKAQKSGNYPRTFIGIAIEAETIGGELVCNSILELENFENNDWSQSFTYSEFIENANIRINENLNT